MPNMACLPTCVLLFPPYSSAMAGAKNHKGQKGSKILEFYYSEVSYPDLFVLFC